MFNHVDIFISYHSGEGEEWLGSRLLSAKVFPKSIDHEKPGKCGQEGQGTKPLGIPAKLTKPIKFSYTYSVFFEVSS